MTDSTKDSANEDNASKLAFHPIAGIFPAMEGPEFMALINDIKETGLKDKITLYEGKILDGRNRYRACREAGVRPAFEDFDGDDPVGYVTSKNLVRRHLKTSQRSFSAAKLANLSQERPSKKRQLAALTQDEAAKLFNVPKRSVQRAGEVVRNGVPLLQDMVGRGAIGIAPAAALATYYRDKPDQQRKIVSRSTNFVRKAAKAAQRREIVRRRKTASAKQNGTGRTTAEMSGKLATPESQPIAPVTSAASFRTSKRETEALRKHVIDMGNDIHLDDLIVAPGSKSANARQSEYAIVRIPNSHPRREDLKRAIMDFRDEYNTQVFFKTLPQEPNEPEDEDARHDDGEVGDDD